MKPTQILEGEFESGVLGADGLVIVGFGTPWCRPCRVMVPILEEISSEYDCELTVLTMNAGTCPGLVKRLNVLSIPTILFFSGGDILEKVVGISSTMFMRASIERMLAAKI